MDRQFLQTVREAEVDSILQFLPKTAKILEIGSGAGWQASRLSSNGYDVIGIDIEQVSELSYNYKKERIHDVIIYDGHVIPFKDQTFDVIFTSSVLEHIPHLREFQKEMQRVLKNSGICVHLVPSPAWRFWSIITYYLVRFRNILITQPKNEASDSGPVGKVPPFWKRFILRRHGERGNVLTEFYLYSSSTWKSLFTSTGWKIKKATSGNFFYTGEMFLGRKLSIERRRKLSKFLGSYCYIFILGKSGA